jgi:putative FmdB family regulatory protein
MHPPGGRWRLRYTRDVPTYEYECTACGQHIEVFQRITEDPLTTCGVCGGALRKVFHPAGIVFKGSGFYATDSRSAGGQKDGQKEGKKEGKKDTKKDAGTSAASSGGSSGGDTKGAGSTSAPAKEPSA